MSENGSGLNLGWDLASRTSFVRLQFAKVIAEFDLQWFRTDQRAADDGSASLLEAVAEVLARDVGPWETGWLVRLDLSKGEFFAYVRLGDGSANVSGAASTATTLAEGMGQLSVLFSPKTEPPPHSVPTTFWSYAESDPIARPRRLSAPDWKEISGNYSTRTRAGLHQLIRAKKPAAGRLILWHGEPGTGKTNALRALTRAWKTWCSIEVISDPESLLASGNSYMLEVMTSSDLAPESREWKLVVLEDAGELMTADAKDRTGQALSRLLNITDGLLGEGTKTLVLVTTNEKLSRLHPAVHRPGRCWAEIEFEAIPIKQANRWLRERRSETRVKEATPLAELYALLRGEDYRLDERPTIGFGRALSA